MIGGYLALHALIRLLTGPSLGLDDAEQALFAQSWSLGYRFRQPPLVTWLTLGAIEVMGPGIAALTVVRYTLLAVTSACVFAFARYCVSDPRFAGIATLSLGLIYVFAYYAHHDLTHTTLMGALVAATLLAAARLAARPSLGRHLMLGVVIGLGIIAKWNFVLLALALPLACLLDPRHRKLILDPRAALGALLAALIALPPALWVLDHRTLTTVTDVVLVSEPNAGPALVVGTLALLEASLLFPLPWLPLFLLVFTPALLRGLRTRGMSAHPGAPPMHEPAALAEPSRGPVIGPAMLIRLMAISLGLHWLLVPLFGATTFAERWMHPALMPLPVLIAAVAERGRPGPVAIRGFLVLLALVTVVAIAVRLGHAVLDGRTCRSCRDLIHFEVLAAEFRNRGFEPGTIVVPPDDFHIGGNLRANLREARVIDPAYPPSVWPQPQGNGSCLGVWRHDHPGASHLRAVILEYIDETLDGPPENLAREGLVRAPLAGGGSRRYTLSYVLWPQGAGSCR